LKGTLTILFILLVITVSAQLGGSRTYGFLELTNSSRVAALGSNFLTVNDDDITLAYSNPALISKQMSTKLALNYLNYFSDINAGFVSYGQHFDKAGDFVATVQFINYGIFEHTDNAGNNLGNFKAGEYAFTVGWSKQLWEKFAVGVNLKNIYSSLDRYTSYGLAADIAANYHIDEQHLSASLIFSNIGRQITTYTGSDNEPIPFNIKFGLSKKFEHAPLRLFFLADNLQRWDLTYSDPGKPVEKDPFTGEPIEDKKGWDFGDKLMRHIVVAGEFAPGKGNFALRLGYNYRRREEMKIASRKAMVGFSWGFGIKVYRFHISYGRATYSLAGATNLITITTRISEFLK